MTLRDYLKQQGYTTVSADYLALVDRWEQWYQGNVKDFHSYTIFNGTKHVSRTRAQLNMAKQGAEYWANLLWNNDCFITLDDERSQAQLDVITAQNDFTRRTNMLVEQAFALGTGAYVVYKTPEGNKIEYLPAGRIYPLEWDGDDCRSCAFANISMGEGNKRTLYLMIHMRQPNGSYRIFNEFFSMAETSDDLTKIPTPPGVLDSYRAETKRFALVRPNIVNNADAAPMGVSIYGNSIDILKCLDLAFDGVKVSMELGRPRVAISASAAKFDPNTIDPVFDPNDIAFYQLEPIGNPEGKEIIQDLTTPYRAGEFELSLQRALTLYSQQIGLGDKAFRWDSVSRGAVTATQVIAENGSMLRTMEKHQDGLRSAITDVTRALLDVAGIRYDGKILIQFDDSATRDRAGERARFWQFVTAGLFPFWRYLMEFEGYSEQDAKDIEAQAKSGEIDFPGEE